MSDPNNSNPYQSPYGAPNQPGQDGGVTPPPPPPSQPNPDAYGSQGGYGTDSSGYGSASASTGYTSPASSAPAALGYSTPSGYHDPNSPDSKGSRAGLVGVIAGIVGLAVGLGGGFAIWGMSDDEPKTSASSSPSTSPTEGESPTPSPSETSPGDDVTSEPPADEKPPAPASGAAGTRKDPLPIKTEFSGEDWDVILGEPKEATAAVLAENQFNEKPKDGFEFYTVPVHATYTGDESGLAWLDLTVRFVGDDGRTYDDSCGVVPDALMDVSELYEGGVAEGNACVAVPAGAAGLWTLTTGWGDPVFFSAK